MQDFHPPYFDHWIPIKKIQAFIQLETFVVLLLIGLACWFFYRMLLKEISSRRHARLRTQFRRVSIFWLISAVPALIFWIIHEYQWQNPYFYKLATYFSLFSLITAAFCLVLLGQLVVYLYLFFQNMNVGVPRLIVNLFTLVFGTCVFAWISSEVFGFALMPLLATSAVFSLVLGLALQDTLGNLFSGVALQIERPYNIGDWIEIYTGTYQWIGQIQEINWRATILLSYSEEMISIPNKVMAQSQIVVVSNGVRAPRRNQTYYLPHNADFQKAKEIIKNSTLKTPGVLSDPEPIVLSIENNPSWIVVKVFYSVDDFSRQYRIGDKVFHQGLIDLQTSGIEFAKPTLEVSQNKH